MSEQRYGPPTVPIQFRCNVCGGWGGNTDPIAQDQWYDCESCGGTGYEKIDVQGAMRSKVNEDLEAAEVRRDRLIFRALDKIAPPSEGSPEAVIANLREAMATMEMHRFESPQKACQDAIDLIERMGKELQAWQMSLEGIGWRSRNYFNILMEIHQFLYPPDKTVDGKTYRFKGVDNSDEILRILSEKIRTIPERMTRANGG